MNALAIGNNSNNALPCYHFNAALAELLDYNVHVKIPKGKIKELALKYQLTAKEYARLKVYASRARHDNGNKLDAGALRRSNRKYPVDVHGRIFRQTTIPSVMWEKLPFKCVKTKLKGFSTGDVSINAFGNGRVEVYEKTGNSRTVLTEKFAQFGWTNEWIALFFEALNRNYKEVHVSIFDPDAPEYCNLPLEFKNGMVKAGVDSTPFRGKKTLEIITTYGDLDDKVSKLTEIMSKFTGNTSIATALIQLNARIDSLFQLYETHKPSPIIPPNLLEKALPKANAERSQELSSLESSQRTIPNRCPRLKEQFVNGQLEYYCPARKETVWRGGSPVYRNFICLTDSAGCLYMEVNSK